MTRPIPTLACAVLATWIAFAVACSGDGGPAEPVDLSQYERSVFSQHGEDGVIEKIFELIEPTSRYAVEFGASNGVRNSNTRNLFLNHGWSGLLIEGDPKQAAQVREAYAELPKVTTLEAWVYPGNIELLFEDAGVPTDLDFLVIDIDSNDYYVWKVMHEFRPKVVMIEVNPYFPPPQKMVIRFHPMNFWDWTDYAGASITSMIELGKKKGYEPVYFAGGFNLFFVERQYFDRFGIEDNSAEALYEPPAPAEMVYDKSPQGRGDVPFEKPYLEVGNVRIEKKFLFDR